MAKRTWKEAIEIVLRTAPQGLHYKEITDRILEQNLKDGGATPAATVNAVLAGAIKKADSPFVKASPALYRLLDAPTEDSAGVEEEPTHVVTSFGLYWDRSAVSWKATPHLWGEYQTAGAAKANLTQVDFGPQHGVYLLHDIREVIYVGRTTSGALGKRLSDHTKDKLRGRWNRFSWFGFRPVGEDGKLGPKIEEFPSAFRMENLIALVEAILIESLEPRQNKKAGDDFRATEYRQVRDPGIEDRKRKLIEALVAQF